MPESNKIRLEQIIELPEAEVIKWNDLLNSSNINYDDMGFGEFSTVWCKTVKFSDGFEVDIKICSDSRDDGDLWNEAVLFDENGCEFCHSEVCDGIDGEYELSWVDRETGVEHIYLVTVKASKHLDNQFGL